MADDMDVPTFDSGRLVVPILIAVVRDEVGVGEEWDGTDRWPGCGATRVGELVWPSG